MQEYLNFVMAHWLLCSALVVLIIALIVVEGSNKVGGIHQWTPHRVVTAINREDALVFDVRPQDLFKKGHITGAINLPLATLAGLQDKVEKYQQRLIIICATGNQGQVVAQKLKKQGFEKLHILAGGIAAWQADNLPLEKGN